MTDGKDETWSPAKMSVARRRPWSVVADCSMTALQPQESRGHCLPMTIQNNGTKIDLSNMLNTASCSNVFEETAATVN